MIRPDWGGRLCPRRILWSRTSASPGQDPCKQLTRHKTTLWSQHGHPGQRQVWSLTHFHSGCFHKANGVIETIWSTWQRPFLFVVISLSKCPLLRARPNGLLKETQSIIWANQLVLFFLTKSKQKKGVQVSAPGSRQGLRRNPGRGRWGRVGPRGTWRWPGRSALRGWCRPRPRTSSPDQRSRSHQGGSPRQGSGNTKSSCDHQYNFITCHKKPYSSINGQIVSNK